jgi:hypothetical protein
MLLSEPPKVADIQWEVTMIATNPQQRPTTGEKSRRRKLPRILGILAGALALVAGGIAIASASSSDGENGGHVITLRTTLVSATNNSAGLGGAGDVIANLNSFVTSKNVTGHADITCQIFPNSEQECTASFVFPEGMIDASAAITLPLSHFTAPITGGSGAYEGVSGHIDNVVVSPGVIDRTFYLTYPRRS